MVLPILIGLFNWTDIRWESCSAHKEQYTVFVEDRILRIKPCLRSHTPFYWFNNTEHYLILYAMV